MYIELWLCLTCLHTYSDSLFTPFDTQGLLEVLRHAVKAPLLHGGPPTLADVESISVHAAPLPEASDSYCCIALSFKHAVGGFKLSYSTSFGPLHMEY